MVPFALWWLWRKKEWAVFDSEIKSSSGRIFIFQITHLSDQIPLFPLGYQIQWQVIQHQLSSKWSLNLKSEDKSQNKITSVLVTVHPGKCWDKWSNTNLTKMAEGSIPQQNLWFDFSHAVIYSVLVCAIYLCFCAHSG